MRSVGSPATTGSSAAFTPASTSRSRSRKSAIVSGVFSARTNRACRSVRVRKRSYALRAPTATTYAAVKRIRSARFGSRARNATSHTSSATAAVTFPAASKGTSANGTPSRRASSRAISTETPESVPEASRAASTALP
jgi:hypothetical protein